MSIERKKEVDVVVRQKLIREIDKSRDYMKNILNGFKSENSNEIANAVKMVINELDIFSNEAELSEVSHKYPRFSPQKSAGSRTIKKLIKYDKSMVDNMEDVTEACKRLSNAVLEEEDIDTVKELQKIRQYITNVRNDYKNRIDKLKGVK
jgi:hypothetical protein